MVEIARKVKSGEWRGWVWSDDGMVEDDSYGVRATVSDDCWEEDDYGVSLIGKTDDLRRRRREYGNGEEDWEVD